MPDFSDGVIHVDYGHTADAADNMLTQTAAIETTLDHLEQELVVLQSWVGNDSIQYTENQQEWEAAVQQMSTDLKANSTLLMDIGANYQRSEQRLADALRD